MLARQHRLARGRDISRVMARGRWGNAGPLTVKAAPNPDAPSRLVVVVSKKVSKKATVRNRIRRRIGSIIADRWETVAPGYDIVLTVRSDVSEMPIAELAELVSNAAANARVIKTS